MNDITLIPHIPATAEEKDELDAIMRRGNKVLADYHKRVKNKLSRGYTNSAGVVIEPTGRYSKRHYRAEVFKLMKAGLPIIIHEIGIPKSDFALILKVKEIEYRILGVYAKLICKFANQWAKMNHGTTLTFEDFYNEGVAATLNAIYAFTKDDIKFMTFVHNTIHRSFLNVTNSAKPLSPWTQPNKKLFGHYQKTRQKLGMEVSFDEVISIMELDDDSVKDLRSMLRGVLSQSDVTNKDSEEFDAIGILGATFTEKPSIASGFDLAQLTNIPMTKWEKAVLDAFLNGGRGWATDVARAHRTPETGTEYSRRAPKIALDRVMDRIRKQLGNVEADAA